MKKLLSVLKQVSLLILLATPVLGQPGMIVPGTLTLTHDNEIHFDGSSFTLILNKTDPTAARTITFPDADGVIQLQGSSGVELVTMVARKGSVGTIAKGSPVYVISYNVGGYFEVEEADSDSANMPAIGIANEAITNAADGEVVVLGEVTGLNTSGWNDNPPDELWVSTTSGALTSIKPTGTALIQKMAVTLRSHATLGTIQVFGSGKLNDLPNLPDGQYWLGNASGVPIPVTMSGDVTQTNAGVTTVADDSHSHSDGTVADAITASNYVLKAGDTMTGPLNVEITDEGTAITSADDVVVEQSTAGISVLGFDYSSLVLGSSVDNDASWLRWDEIGDELVLQTNSPGGEIDIRPGPSVDGLHLYSTGVAAFPQAVRLWETGAGTNYVSIASPAAITADRTCVLEDDATPFDSCITPAVGDGVGYDEVMEEAVGLTKRAQLNFIGTGITCVDNAGATRTDCTVSSGGGTKIQDADGDTYFETEAAADDDILRGYSEANQVFYAYSPNGGVQYRIALGKNCSSSGLETVCIGDNGSASGNYAYSIGPDSSAAGTRDLALGQGVNLTGGYAVGAGFEADCAGNGVCLGSYANTLAATSLAAGYEADVTAAGVNGVAVGPLSDVSAGACSAFGYASLCDGYGSTLVGNDAQVDQVTGRATVVGWDTNADQYGVIVGAEGSGSGYIGHTNVGWDSDSSATYCSAFGYNADCLHTGSKVFSPGGFSTAVNQFVIGSSTQSTTGLYGGNGVTNASPVTWTIYGTSGSGTDISGADMAISGGIGTGTGISGNINFAIALAGTTGSSLNTPVLSVQVPYDGGLDVEDVGTKPTCNSDHRGTQWVDEGGAGVADTTEECIKDGADTYKWRSKVALGIEVKQTTNQSISATTWTTVNFETENIDQLSAFNTTSDQFTAPDDGWYFFETVVLFTATENTLIAYDINDAAPTTVPIDVQCGKLSGEDRHSCAKTFYLSSGDTVDVLLYTDTASTADETWTRIVRW